MKTHALAVLAMFGILCPSSPSFAADNPLIGEWFPAEINDQGLGSVMIFEPNGRMIVSAGAAVYLKYKVQENTIVMQPPEGPSESMVFAVTNNTLTLDCGDGKKQKLTRVPGTGGEGLLGKWTGKGPAGREVREFTTNILYLTVPFMTATGTYTLKGNTLRMEYPGKRVSAKWKLADDVLTITYSGEEPGKFRRKETSAPGVAGATAPGKSPLEEAALDLMESVKIDHLLKQLEAIKDATFIRNDKAMEMKEAVPMMRRKWEAEEEDIKTANEFIEKIMTASSSGAKKPYLIRYKDGRETPCADFLKAELKKLEENARKNQRL